MDAIRAINARTDLSLEEKTRAIQQLLTSSQPRPQVITFCTHSIQNCSIYIPCCQRFYACTECHDEQQPSHKLVIDHITEMKCNYCGERQPIAQWCKYCVRQMGTYFCFSCRLWDTGTEYHHCNLCNRCHQGTAYDYRYCSQCHFCLLRRTPDFHVHNPHALQESCTICLQGPLATTRDYIYYPCCGHAVHENCYREYIQSDYRCPSCRKTFTYVLDRFFTYEMERYINPTPPEYSYPVSIYCNDCEVTQVVTNNLSHLRCENVYCQSFNVRLS